MDYRLDLDQCEWRSEAERLAYGRQRAECLERTTATAAWRRAFFDGVYRLVGEGGDLGTLLDCLAILWPRFRVAFVAACRHEPPRYRECFVLLKRFEDAVHGLAKDGETLSEVIARLVREREAS